MSVTVSNNNNTRAYKGKFLRSWAQLPPEVLRLTIKFCVPTSIDYPRTWAAPQCVAQNSICRALKDVDAMSQYMAVCTAWHKALQSSSFWEQAIRALDPPSQMRQYQYRKVKALHSTGSNFPPIPLQYTPFAHFQHLMVWSCTVCRINHVHTSRGWLVQPVPRPSLSIHFGTIFVCREHRKTTFCERCLIERDLHNSSGVMRNEDYLTWPSFDFLCTFCRRAALVSQIEQDQDLRAALINRRTGELSSEEWETHEVLESFLVNGEGRLCEVLDVAREKYWLRTNTKLSGLMQQAMASSKLARQQEAYDGMENDEDIYSDEEEDSEWLHSTENSAGVKEIALRDWARTRILDGFWIAPADIYANDGNKDALLNVPHAIHPCPWVEDTASHLFTDQEIAHPRPHFFRSRAPPTYELCEEANRAYHRAIREIVLPAMSNVVRYLVVEYASKTDGGSVNLSEPCIRANSLGLDEIGVLLRSEGAWFTGVDWAKRLSDRMHRRGAAQHHSPSSDRDSISQRSSPADSSTSPVMSTTTIQTTPSPPPVETLEHSKSSDVPALTFPIPTSPVLPTPVLLHSIPHVPEIFSVLPKCTLEVLKQSWRIACEPLFACQCSICARVHAVTITDSSPENQLFSQNPPTTEELLAVVDDQESVVLTESHSEELPDEDLLTLGSDGVNSPEPFQQAKYEVNGDQTTASFQNNTKPSHSPPLGPRKRSSAEIDGNDKKEVYVINGSPCKTPKRQRILLEKGM